MATRASDSDGPRQPRGRFPEALQGHDATQIDAEKKLPPTFDHGGADARASAKPGQEAGRSVPKTGSQKNGDGKLQADRQTGPQRTPSAEWAKGYRFLIGTIPGGSSAGIWAMPWWR